MQRQIVAGQWAALREPILRRWDRLDDDAFGRAAGKLDALLDELVAAYGMPREQAESEVTEFMLGFDPERVRPKE